MKRLILLLSIIAANASAQATNTVNISNSLLGPVTNLFTNTQINVSEAVITGAVFNATNLVQVDPTIIITNLFTDVFDVALDGTIVGKGNDGERTIRPSTNNVADLGTETNQWRKVYGVEILVDNVSLPPIPRVSPTEAGGVILQYDPVSTQYFWAGIGYPAPTFTGTNVATFTKNYVDSGDNALTWEVPVGVTNIAVHAWGAAGGSASVVGGAGGYVYAILATVPGTVYEVIVGNGGNRSATGNTVVPGAAPGGGNTYIGLPPVFAGSGGGYSGLKINNTTNYIVVAGSGSGGLKDSYGSNGGGISGQDGYTVGSNVVAGIGASADSFYGKNAVGGTNTTGFGSGGFLQGGHAQTNAFGSNLSGLLGGGGSGWYGGSAGDVTAATGNGVAIGGGGISYANPDYVTFAYSVRSPTAGTAPVQDLPFYVSGRANGAVNSPGQPGLVVIQY